MSNVELDVSKLKISDEAASELDDLVKLLKQRIGSVRGLMERSEEEPLRGMEGVDKFRNRLESEMRFLKQIETGRKNLERKYLDTSNVIHYESVVESMRKFDDVIAIMKTFAIRDWTENEEGESDDWSGIKPRMLKQEVDLVAGGGRQWIKVVARSPQGIISDWLTRNTRNYFEQARDYLEMTDVFKHNYVPPEIVFVFSGGIADKMAECLQRIGVTVVGEKIDINTLANVPSHVLEMLDDEPAYVRAPREETSPSRETPLKIINLDVSSIFALISNLTHEGGLKHKYSSSMLNDQAAKEALNPVRESLLKQIDDLEWIMCQTAFEATKKIVCVVGGAMEIERWDEMKKRIRVVADEVSYRASFVKATEKIDKRNLIIFGTGDEHNAVTVTANKRFVSSAFHQGIPFDVIIHEARALSEQKEISEGEDPTLHGKKKYNEKGKQENVEV